MTEISGLCNVNDYYPHNFSPEISAEYLVHPSIGLYASYRQGFGVISKEEVATWDFIEYGEGNDMIYQISFFPKYYVYGQKLRSLFTGPVLNFGRSTHIIQYEYAHFDISPETNERDLWNFSEYDYDREIENYFEVGWGAGILFNVGTDFTVMTQLIVLRANITEETYYQYTNFLNDNPENFYLEYTTSYSYQEIRMQLQLLLMYRFGK